jgi:hypothetical protein
MNPCINNWVIHMTIYGDNDDVASAVLYSVQGSGDSQGMENTFDVAASPRLLGLVIVDSKEQIHK